MKTKEAPMLVDAREVSKVVGVSQELLRKLAREGKIPFYRLSARTLRFDLDEVRSYMKLIAQGRPQLDDENAAR
jgi:excisionase family DNA binding protein